MTERRQGKSKLVYDKATRSIVAKCGACDGRGQVPDYVGLEMKCVGVECDRCGGTGRVSIPMNDHQERKP